VSSVRKRFKFRLYTRILALIPRTTTLEDIYKNYASKNLVNSTVQNHSFEPRYSRKDTQPQKQQMDYEDDAWEVGAVTGYAVHEPANVRLTINVYTLKFSILEIHDFPEQRTRSENNE
jgi:hypothetical protein